VVATAQDGLVASSQGSARFSRRNPKPRDHLDTPGVGRNLLIGTKKRGVLIYDGKHLAPLHPAVNRLLCHGPRGYRIRFVVGTLDHALPLASGAVESSVRSRLPDRQVQCLTTSGEKTYVGTVLGVAVFDNGVFDKS